MGTIVISTIMSLDGIIEDPDGKEGHERGGWFEKVGGADLGPWAELSATEAIDAAALLLGRTSDQWFASRWTDRATEWADQLNALPKYVVSSTLEPPQWTNATVLRGDLAKEVAAVKEAHEGEILVYASGRLVQALLDEGLADELRLVVFPVLLGGGRRLFGETVDPKRLRLVDVHKLGVNLTFQSYEVVK
jgi:dihydrofolate reductase